MKAKKLLAGVLSAAMVLGTMALPAFADANNGTADWATNADKNVIVYGIGDNNADVYYEYLEDALNDIYKKAPTETVTVECRPDAELGVTNGSNLNISDSITIKGNGAKLKNVGFEIDWHSFDRAVGMYAKKGKTLNKTGNETFIDKNVTFTVENLENVNFLSTRNTDYDVDINLIDCKNVNQVYITEVGKGVSTGKTNISLSGCTFNTTSGRSDVKVFSHYAGSIEVDNCEFDDIAEPIKLNNKSTSNQAVTVKDSTFTDCATEGSSSFTDIAPIGVMSSGTGANTTLNVTGCAFTYNSTTPANGQVRIGTGEAGKTSNPVLATIENNNSDVVVDTLKPGEAAVEKTIAAGETETISNAITDTVALRFDPTADERVYDIVLSGEGKNINRLNAAEFVFDLSNADMTYEIKAADKLTTLQPDVDKYVFYFDGKDNIGDADTQTEITIGTVTFDGYGVFTFGATDGRVMDTTNKDNLVNEFVVGGATGKGTLVIENDENKLVDKEIAVPTHTLTINVLMNHPVTANAADYQDMTVAISGGDLAGKVLTYKLGDADAEIDATTKTVAMTANGSYEIAEKLTENRLYTVTVTGAGYRTARYTVNMSEDKTMSVWNNVMTDKIVVVDDTKTTKNFLAGDIIRDGAINIYDLSAVVAYFGQPNIDTTTTSKFAKYDLNRDGVIDMMDISIVLTSWGE